MQALAVVRLACAGKQGIGVCGLVFISWDQIVHSDCTILCDLDALEAVVFFCSSACVS